MKKFFAAVTLLLASAFAVGQNATVTTLTTVQNGPYQKAIYAVLPAVDENGFAATVIVDNRFTGSGPIGGVTVSSVDFTGSARGTLSGVSGNPNGTRQPYTGTGTYFGTGHTADGTLFNVYGVLPYHAFYESKCAPRTPTCGWHYSFDAGSIIAVQFPGQIL